MRFHRYESKDKSPVRVSHTMKEGIHGVTMAPNKVRDPLLAKLHQSPELEREARVNRLRGFNRRSTDAIDRNIGRGEKHWPTSEWS